MPEALENTGIIIQKRMDQILASNMPGHQSLYELKYLFELVFEKASEQSEIAFTTLFARISFVNNHFSLPKQIAILNQQVRRYFQFNDDTDLLNENFEEILKYLISKNLNLLFGLNQEVRIDAEILDDFLISKNNKHHNTYRILTGLLEKVDILTSRFLFTESSNELFESWVSLDQVKFIKEPKEYLNKLDMIFDKPFQLNLIDVKVVDKVLYPKAIVIKPNFLINITAVAEGFKYNGKFTSLMYLTRKFIPTESSAPLIKGNIANFMLDELIHDPGRDYKSMLPEIFQLFPLYFSAISDADLRTLLSELQVHYSNLKNSIDHELKGLGIDKDKIYLEPSFYSVDYGFQGRLDLFHVNESNSQIDIIELKSGKVFRPNVYKICNNHFVQTLLYGLLIEKIIARSQKPSLYILYSSESQNSLRFAPTIRDKQMEAIHERNELLMVESELLRLKDEEGNGILAGLNPQQLKHSDTFLKRDATLFWNHYAALDSIEKSYLKHFIGFVSREYHLSKTGEHGMHKSNGLAGVWLDSLEEKKDNFRILSYLKIKDNLSDEEYPIIIFEYSDKSNRLSKFRKGDISILYPYYGNADAILENQIFKCSILKVTENELHVKLRFQQKNLEYFNRFEYWNLEFDMLDSSFNSHFNGLYEFISTDKTKRELILGRRPPAPLKEQPEVHIPSLTAEQNEILNNILACQDYYLLWGPPGTGKTSFMIRELVKELFSNSDENILLLAYTNRSVDEICSAVNSIENNFENFIRLGSRISTDERFSKMLLSQKIKEIRSRSTLKKLIEDNRIFVSTVSSISSNRDLFSLIEFDTIIIDEASQILEPMLVGLLPKAKRFILIGDHKQLPAVVTQSEFYSKVNEEDLNTQLRLKNMRSSLFERLFLQCHANHWDWAAGVLTQQGRMHDSIMKFSSQYFYEGKLSALPSVTRLHQNLNWEGDKPVFDFLTKERIIFINTPLDNSLYRKVNVHEASVVRTIVQELLILYQINGEALTENSIGIITPFRAQITQIIQELSSLDFNKELISVDTVERYQGSAREKIVISLCTNDSSLLESMSAVSEEGLDRKLNVALTRAKEQLIIIGNEKLLSSKDIYRKLINYAFKIDFMELIDPK